MTVDVEKQEECLKFFSQDIRDRVKEIQKHDDKYAWESMLTSKFSPGVVACSELVCRDLFSPTYYDAEKEEVKPTFFDDVSNKGGSCDRLAHTTLSEIRKRSTDRHAVFNLANPAVDKQRSSIGLVQLLVSDIRLHRTDDCQTMCVYDTALEENRAHADIALVHASKAAFRSARSYLFEKYVLIPNQNCEELNKSAF